MPSPKRPSLLTTPAARPVELPTLRERQEKTLAQRATHTATQATAKKATAKKATATTPQQSRGTRPTGAPEGTTPVHLYLPVALHDAARDAYAWQYSNGTTDRQTSMGRWVGAALAAYARMTPARRAQLTHDLDTTRGGQAMRSRTYYAPDADVAAMEDARRDSEQWTQPDGTLKTPTGSKYAQAALWVAVRAVQQQAGGELPKFAGRLPYDPE